MNKESAKGMTDQVDDLAGVTVIAISSIIQPVKNIFAFKSVSRMIFMLS